MTKESIIAKLNRVKTFRLIVPITFSLSIIIITVFIWQLLLKQEQYHINQLTHLQLENSKDEIITHIQTKILTFSRMAKRWERHGGLSKEEWGTDALSYIKDLKGLLAIEWADPAFRVKWVVPLKDNEPALGFDLLSDQRIKGAVLESYERRWIMFSPPIELVQGGRGFLVFVPLYRQEKFDGFIVGVFRFKELFDVALKNIGSGYSIGISINYGKVYSRQQPRIPYERSLIQQIVFSLYGTIWHLHIRPGPEHFGKLGLAIPDGFLLFGVIISILFGLTIYFIQMNKLRTKQIVLINQRLEEEIIERRQAEHRILYLNAVLRSINKISQLIIKEKNRDVLLSEACNIIIKNRNYQFVWIGLVKEGSFEVAPAAQAGFSEGYLENIRVSWDDSVCGLGPTGTAIKSHSPCVVTDIVTDPNFTPWREEALKRNYASCLAIPILLDNKVLGAIDIYSRYANAFNQDEIDLFMGLAEDIGFALHTIGLENARSQMENDLRESEEKYHKLIESSNDAIFLFDAETGVILEVNKRAQEMLGMLFEEIVGLKYSQIHPGEEGKYYQKIFEQVAKKQRATFISEELFLVNKDGNKIPVTVSTNTVEAEGRKIIQAVFRDISARKKIEEELRVSQEALQKTREYLEVRVQKRTSELARLNVDLQDEVGARKKIEEELRRSDARYQKIISALTDYTYTVRVENNQASGTAYGPGCLAVTGYSSQDFLENPYLWIEIVPEDERELIQETASRILKDEDVGAIEHRIIRRDGAFRWVRNTFVRHYDNGRMIGYDGIVKDITEQVLKRKK